MTESYPYSSTAHRETSSGVRTSGQIRAIRRWQGELTATVGVDVRTERSVGGSNPKFNYEREITATREAKHT